MRRLRAPDPPALGCVDQTAAPPLALRFITVTTFTTWHRNFRWDSLHPSAGVLDFGDGETSHDHVKGVKVDREGSISRDLMAQIYAGDPDGEGIVWPRVAELSLLGALGCGGWLLQLVIDGLETEQSPYRYVVTQATDNSVPFYERMGFVRVGAVSAVASKKKKKVEADEEAEGGGKAGKRKAKEETPKSTEVSSRVTTHMCDAHETCASVAAQYDVAV